jgi:hypothetical protein
MNYRMMIKGLIPMPIPIPTPKKHGKVFVNGEENRNRNVSGE